MVISQDVRGSTWNVQFCGARLLEARQAMQMSRFTLARAIDFMVGPTTIERYEHDETVPSLNVALELVRALNIHLEDLTRAPR